MERKNDKPAFAPNADSRRSRLRPIVFFTRRHGGTKIIVPLCLRVKNTICLHLQYNTSRLPRLAMTGFDEPVFRPVNSGAEFNGFCALFFFDLTEILGPLFEIFFSIADIKSFSLEIYLRASEVRHRRSTFTVRSSCENAGASHSGHRHSTKNLRASTPNRGLFCKKQKFCRPDVRL